MDPYPMTIVEDRYTGAYSGGLYTAWNNFPWEVPEAIFGDDSSCFDFWRLVRKNKSIYLFGVGQTPEEAAKNLREKINSKSNVD